MKEPTLVTSTEPSKLTATEAGMRLFGALAVIGLILGFALGESAVQEAALFAAAAVCGILARLCQAALYQKRILEALRQNDK